MNLPINIVFCCDDAYAAKLAVAAYSLLRSNQSSVALFVIDCGISEKNKQLVYSLQTKCHNLVSVVFKNPDRITCFEDFPVSPWFSSAIFYRLAIPEIFPDIARAIYLDCDVIVDADITELWHTDLGNCSFSALNDEGNFLLSEDAERRKKVAGIPLNRIYMSSGVLLLDSQKFVKSRILERVIEVIKNHHGALVCPEQDAMNICIGEDEYVPLDPRFNFTPFANLAKKRIREGIVPAIIHYSCMKPWTFNRKLVDWLYKSHLFRYELGFIEKYWHYSDDIDPHGYSAQTVKVTIKALYKRVFGPIEYFVAKKVRNKIIRTFRCFLQKRRG